MSRIGKKQIDIPAGVTVTVDGQTVAVKGPKGQLSWTVVDEIEVKQEAGVITLTPRADNQRSRAMWGLSRTLVANMVEGVTKGYEEVLELVGVGYRAAMKGQARFSIQLGFSHDRRCAAPGGHHLRRAAPGPKSASGGIDKQLVGEIAARIRKVRPPEPYKGKGVRYAGESVRRKEGKKK